MPPTSQPPQRISVEERLFSLVLALIATESGLTKAEILETVQGYRQRYQRGGDNASLERQFERDKDDIRELGIPLETIEPLDESGSNHNLRYRIPKGLYDLPSDVSFTSDELMLLKLAAAVWREGSLSSDSQRALTKLNSLGVDSTDPVLGYAPHLRARDAAFEPLSKAMDRSQVVTFPYLKPGEPAPRRRTVAPLAVVLHEGRWHLHAADQESGQRRTFLLSRIVGPVTPVPGKTFTPEPDGQAHHALEALDRLWEANTARVRVVPESEAELLLRKRTAGEAGPAGRAEEPAGTDQALILHFTDIDILADELAGFGPEVLVLDPPRLQEAVMERLRRVAEAHAAPDGEDTHG
ncbi:helix-turn-helix transcriptional regulator [Cryobacterium tepidiphilum]|uniref:WYL domain-containing protein n=1 Tax=Cryobacterium tepidiphilum TaxID=2486026 RepID=A0A3M8L1D9_9MICO|nr:WYL domain-containing protein [Cryobacterium tepidiphilum]RNE59367.1 WYL domain-containing protein [Cryobacterium tepidiphilum]